MKPLVKSIFPFLVLLIPISIFFYPVILQGKLPIPADTIAGLYHPMRDALSDEYPNGPPFKNFLITDAIRQQYPWRQFAIDELKSGRIPWWNPYNFAGTPHLANFQSAPFYPLNFIFWITDFTTAWSLLVMLQPLLGTVFLYLYLINLKLHRLSAIFGSLTWIFSGTFVAWLEWNTAVHVVVWSPLILLSIDKLFPEKSPDPKRESSLLARTLVKTFHNPTLNLQSFLSRSRLTSIIPLRYRNAPGSVSPGREVDGKKTSVKVRNDSPATRNSSLWSIILLVALISQAQAGYPQPWVYFSLIQITYLLWRMSLYYSVKTVVKIGVIYLLLTITISIQLITSAQFANLSNRIADQGDVLAKQDWFLPYQNLVQLIVPDYFGNPATLNYWGIFNYTEFVSFIGITAFIFILALWLSARLTRTAKFFTLFTIISFILATNNPISILQFQLNLPLIGSSQPSRWLFITTFCLAILSAHGFQLFLTTKSKFKLTLSTFLTGIILALAWIFTRTPDWWTMPATPENLSVTTRNLILPTLEFGLVSLILLFPPIFKSKLFSNLISHTPLHNLLKPSRLQPVIIASLLLIFISTSTGLRFAWKFTPFSDPHLLYPQSQILTYLQDNAGIYRYMTTDRRLMAPNINMAYNLYTIEGYDPLYLAEYGRLIYSSERGYLGDQSKPFNRIIALDNPNSPIVDLLGVKYILSLNPLDYPHFTLIMEEGDTKLYQNGQVLPRAFVTTTSSDPFNLELVAAANITLYTPTLITISTHNTPPGYLVLTDAYHPNWTATRNGQKVDIINWNGLRATIVPEGNHELIYRYTPL